MATRREIVEAWEAMKRASHDEAPERGRRVMQMLGERACPLPNGNILVPIDWYGVHEPVEMELVDNHEVGKDERP